jgi:hypothetical protein
MSSSRDGKVRLAPVLHVPWDAATGIPSVFGEVTRTGVATPRPPRLMRAAVRLRVTPWGGLTFVAPCPDGTRLACQFSQGVLLQRTGLQPPFTRLEAWGISDFLADASGCLYLLETGSASGKTYNFLRKCTAQGEVLWQRQGVFSAQAENVRDLEGSFRQLLMDANGTPYLPATAHRGAVVRIDPDSATFEPYADWGQWTGEVFMDGGGVLYFVRYVAEAKSRGWARYDPRTRKEALVLCAPEVYPLLALPVGVDDCGRAYAVSGMCLGCIADGFHSWSLRFDNLLRGGPKHSLYASRLRRAGERGQVMLTRWDAEGSEQGLPVVDIPDDLLRGEESCWYLIDVDAAENFYVSSNETQTRESVLLSYSSAGLLTGKTRPAPAVHLRENRLQAARSWAVDLEGAVYLPILGSSGLDIVQAKRPG